VRTTTVVLMVAGVVAAYVVVFWLKLAGIA
jgi:hypothetical protein